VKKSFLSLFSLALLFWSAASLQADTAMIDRILATVNGDIITLSEFGRFKALMYMGSPEKPAGREADRELLNSLIEKKLLLQEAKRLEVEVKGKEVEDALEDMLKRNNINVKTLREELAKQGATVEDYKILLKEELMQSHVVGRQVHSKISITDKDVEDYYRKNMQSGEKKGPRVRIQQILLLLPRDASPGKAGEVERSAADVHQKLVAGDSFEELAAMYSEGAEAKTGGDLGYFHKGELMPEIEKVAFDLKEGEVSPVIKTALGFHIIKVLKKDSGDSDKPWEGQEREIKGMLYNMEFEKRLKDWLGGIKEKAYIEINE